jgi:hypothetical protein
MHIKVIDGTQTPDAHNLNDKTLSSIHSCDLEVQTRHLGPPRDMSSLYDNHNEILLCMQKLYDWTQTLKARELLVHSFAVTLTLQL